jgi:hypothetical protein
MPISIACPSCDWKGRVKDELAGKTGKCPTCGKLIPIPKKGAPPPVRAGKKSADDEPDVVDDADIVEDADVVEEKPRSKSRSRDEDERPRRRRDEDEDDRPRKRRRDDDEEEDRPSRSRRRDDDDEDDHPRKRRRDDDDEDDRPRRRKRPGGKVRRRESGRADSGGGMSGARMSQLVGAIIFLLIGVALVGFYLLVGGRFSMLIWGGIVIVISILSLIHVFMDPSGGDDE